MPSIKLHVFSGPNDGTESCDFRGDKFVGSQQGDQHRTLMEKDPASDEEVAAVLALGPSINVVLSQMVPGDLIGILWKNAGLRLGVWDE